MIKVENIEIDINGNKIIKGIDFSVNRGEFISLIGPNGSGKSTLIKGITGKIAHNKGKVLIVDKNLSDYKSKELAKILSTMEQHGKGADTLTAYDIISYGRSPYKNIFSPINDEDKKIISDAMIATDTEGLKDRILTTLSGGEMQRVFLASCLAQMPDILILDEPTNHLDVMHQFKLLSLVKSYAKEKGLTVVCVLHDINQAIKYADKIAVLKDGVIRNFGTDEIITEELVKNIFEIDCEIYRNDRGVHIDFYYNED